MNTTVNEEKPMTLGQLQEKILRKYRHRMPVFRKIALMADISNTTVQNMMGGISQSRPGLQVIYNSLVESFKESGEDLPLDIQHFFSKINIDSITE